MQDIFWNHNVNVYEENLWDETSGSQIKEIN